MSIPGSLIPLFSTGSSTSYQIPRSLRFNAPDSAYLSRTPASASNRKTWTWAGWVKRSGLGAGQTLMEAGGGGVYTLFWFNSSDQLSIAQDNGGGGVLTETSVAVFRDASAWYHIVLAVDTTQATAANRFKMYVNGVELTLTKSTTLAQNADTYINSTNEHRIGYRVGSSAALSAYLAECYLIDGQALTPGSFAETNASTGQWVPKAFSGSYGTNGFKLSFADNSSNTATTLGKDSSPNGNNFTPVNLSTVAGLSSSSQTATCSVTINPYAQVGGWYVRDGGSSSNPYSGRQLVIRFNNTTIYDGGASGSPYTTGGATYTPSTYRGSVYGWAGDFANCYDVIQTINVTTTTDSLVDTPTSYGIDTAVGGEVRGNYCTWNSTWSNPTLTNGNLDYTTTTGSTSAIGTIGVSSGKWYFEITPSTSLSVIGVAPPSTFNTEIGSTAASYGYLSNGNKYNNGSSTAYGSTYTFNDVIGVALDLDNGKIWFSKNGTWQASGNPADGTNAAFTGISGTFTPAVSRYTSTEQSGSLNCGQRAFSNAAPSGFKAICDTSLPAPTVAKPSSSFDVKLYTGNGGTQSVTGLNFSPDLVWLKARSAATAHLLFDQIRGATYYLSSNATDAESNSPSNTLTAFTSDGFTLGSNSSANGSSVALAAWAWDAGTSTVSNTAGSITSQVRANASAGFSVVTYTGTGTLGATVGHGLGVSPKLIIIKDRDSVESWVVYTTQIDGSLDYLFLNSTDAKADASISVPTSNVFSTGGITVTSGKRFVAYAFSPVSGYSSFSSFVGNGSSDGVFQWCGFRPRFILLKSIGATGWDILDSSRNTYNLANSQLFPHASDAELTNSTDYFVADFLSNGFKLRTSSSASNASGQTYIYAAFAESPFQYSRAR